MNDPRKLANALRDPGPKIKVGKLDAARRQLETAISLWFNDGDPVSTLTLAYAAYEVIHVISKKRDPNRRDLLFDSAIIKDDKRNDFNKWIKTTPNFFKHANNDGDAVIEFHPSLAEMFLMFAILGVELCGERKNTAEVAYLWYLQIAHPGWVTQTGREVLSNAIKVEDLQHLRTRPKREFFEAFKIARAQHGL